MAREFGLSVEGVYRLLHKFRCQVRARAQRGDPVRGDG
jgi:hypothetical protein